MIAYGEGQCTTNPSSTMLSKDEKYPEHKNLGLDAKHVIEDEERVENIEGVRFKLGKNDPKNIMDINDKEVKRKSEADIKKFFIHSKETQWTRH